MNLKNENNLQPKSSAVISNENNKSNIQKEEKTNKFEINLIILVNKTGKKDGILFDSYLMEDKVI